MDEQQLLTSVAVAVATKTVEGLTEAGKAAFAALSRLVHRKVGDAAEITQRDDPEQRIAALRGALEDAVRQDARNRSGRL